MDPKVTFIETIEDTETYRIDHVDVFIFEHSDMLSLTIKVHGKEIPIQRWSNADFYLKSIRDKATSWTEEDGFYCTHGRGHPLQEFEDDNLAGFTRLTLEKGLFRFGGNHHRVGGAFGYIIWDQELAQEVDERLEKATKIPM